MVTTLSTRAVSHVILGTISAMGVVNIMITHIFVATGIDTPSSCKVSIKRRICSGP